MISANTCCYKVGQHPSIVQYRFRNKSETKLSILPAQLD